ncbi:hypothetical protein [Rhodoligotrophos defluvii]|uniref:hypothetical protein n=1 Tax=Rhodoligotrophos defluvii TaxID=2561934 RepID=UPI0010C95734|nr:hypothetical protein [Rhodoligotrophos defluvii]
MAVAITKDNLFRLVRPGPQTKAEITNSTARAIIQAEADSREAKTRKLRQARLQMKARQPKPAPAKGRGRKWPDACATWKSDEKQH